MSNNQKKKDVCCLCGKEYIHNGNYGNNPYPLRPYDTEESCCDECNRCKVIPKRMEYMK